MSEFQLPRWIQILCGCILVPFVFLCLIGSLMVAMFPTRSNPASEIVIGSFMVVISMWALGKALRLTFGRGGNREFLGPTALRVIAVFFLLLPFAGFFTGEYLRFGLAALARAVLMELVALRLFLLANERSRSEI